jgi:outer membrane protein assembly factor BamD
LKKKIFLFLILTALTAMFASACSSSQGSDIKTDDPEEAFRIAKGKFDKGDYVDAIEDLSFIKIKFPGSANADQIQFYLAESYYGRKEYMLAAYEYENMLKNYPLSSLIPQTRYKLGLSYYQLSPKYQLDQEFTHYSISELQLYIDLYPTDKNVTDAEVKLKELKDKLAYKDYRTGILYMKLLNYKSAAIYFYNVYENYIESEWADDAMIGHAEALISRKQFDEAKKVLDKFNKLFPGSTLKSRADQLRNKT